MGVGGCVGVGVGVCRYVVSECFHLCAYMFNVCMCVCAHVNNRLNCVFVRVYNVTERACVL